MKYYIIAGEASGDLHGSNLIKAIKSRDNQAEVRAWGGDLMEAAGAQLVKHYKETAYMGFLEVVKHLPDIFKNLDYCKDDISEFKPDALVLIDYSGFNLRIAKWARDRGFTTHYYIAPQVWASREGRVKKLRDYVDHIYVILPFEKAFYDKHGIQVTFVGHPLLDAIDQREFTGTDTFRDKNDLGQKPIIALLPGSRKQEVGKILPVMLEVVSRFPDYQFVIAGAPSLDMEYYKQFTEGHAIPVVTGQTYELLHHAHTALVTSGTATLEAALFNVPQVVCYKGSWLSYWIARNLIRLQYISLVNLIMDKPVVTELIQQDLTTANLAANLEKILDGAGRESVLTDYNELRNLLGGPGASDTAAALIIENS